MDLLSQVKSTIDKHGMISPGDTILVGVSGGPDSLALLHLLNRLKDDLQCRLYAGHLDHMFRGEEAEADARLVESLARQWQVPFVMERVNVPEYIEKHRLSPQQGAREVRYRFYRDAAARLGAVRVALGHHADDQAETVLINLIRGTGLKGLGGMPPAREGIYIRPLLETRKKQIDEYCREFGIPYRVDSSNLKTVYLRNRVRLELMPLLEEKYNPAVVNSLNRLAEIVRAEDEYLDEAARIALEDAVMSREEGKITLSIEKVNCQPVAVRRRMILAGYRTLAGDGGYPAFEQIDRALEMARGDHFRGKIELPGGIDLVKRRRFLEMIRNRGIRPVPFYQRSLRVPGLTPVPEINRSILAEILDASKVGDPRRFSRDQAVLDLESLQGPLFVRRRRDGDVFFPLGAGGKVKLKKFFIDLKVPREQRDAIPIVASGNDIVWVAGYRPGDPWKVTGKTRVCLRLELLEG
ncbi:MAG: tRNA lysidine(34) synthetase TilS [Peptococcaceae bacterium]|nr:tRNA lysidine(34) synthetase TilS [Peptococcaceae bacterium]